jgi:hypothetical protein
MEPPDSKDRTGYQAKHRFHRTIRFPATPVQSGGRLHLHEKTLSLRVVLSFFYGEDQSPSLRIVGDARHPDQQLQVSLLPVWLEPGHCRRELRSMIPVNLFPAFLRRV